MAVKKARRRESAHLGTWPAIVGCRRRAEERGRAFVRSISRRRSGSDVLSPWLHPSRIEDLRHDRAIYLARIVLHASWAAADDSPPTDVSHGRAGMFRVQASFKSHRFTLANIPTGHRAPALYRPDFHPSHPIPPIPPRRLPHRHPSQPSQSQTAGLSP